MSEINKKMYNGIHAKYPLLLSDFKYTWIFSTDFRKILNAKYNENPSSGSLVAPCGRADGQTDIHYEAIILLAILRTRLKKERQFTKWVGVEEGCTRHSGQYTVTLETKGPHFPILGKLHSQNITLSQPSNIYSTVERGNFICVYS
jgi:hypothetical protein